VKAIVKLTVEERLQLETLRRGANGAFPQIGLLIFLMFFIPSFPEIVSYYLAAISLIVIFFMRWILYRKYGNEPEMLIRKHQWTLYLGLSTSLIWAYLCGVAVYHFKLNSFIGILHIFVANGLLAAVMYSFSPTPKIQKAFILFLSIPVVIIILFNESGSMKYCGVLLGIFTLYLLAASKNHSSDLKYAYEFENRLLAEYEKLQEIFDSIPGFVIIVSDVGEWIQYSKSTGNVLNSDRLKFEIRRTLESGQNKKTVELDLGSVDEDCYIVSFEKLFNDEVLVIGLPIGELKKMRTLLETQKAKADYSARLAAIGEMAGGVAHEINNPLTVISITSEFLQSKLKDAHVDSEIWKRHTDKIYETSNKIAKVVKSLQNLTREDVLEQMSNVDLDVVILESIDISSEKMKRKGVILDYKGKGPLWVEGKHVEIGQVLINLINNSFESIEFTGRIEIKTREYKDDVFLCVVDTGRGIQEEIREKLFQPFFSTKEVGKGSGLGLSVSRSLVQGMGGDIELLQSHNPTIFQIKLKKAKVQ
jgi:signal transduction histidine kinase